MAGEKTRDPIYKQVTEALVELIESEFSIGDQFLTERQVSDRFGISRTTANKALSNLVIEGVLEFRKGVGTFVRPPKPSVNLRRLVSFTEKALAAGLRPQTRVHRFRRTRLDELELVPAAEAGPILGLSDDAEVYEMARVRSIDGRTVIYERRCMRSDLCPELEAADVEGSLYTLLNGRLGLSLEGVAQRIRARIVREEEAAVLDVEPGSAGLELAGVGYLTTGDPLWYEETLYRGDVYEFVNQVRITGDGSQSTLERSRDNGADQLWYRW